MNSELGVTTYNNRYKIGNHLSSLLIFAIALVWIWSKWPGVFSPDSLDTWTQVQTLKFADWHPVTFTTLVYFFSIGGNSLLSLLIVQHLLMICFVKYSLSIVLPHTSVLNRNLLSALIYLLPFVGSIASTVWKDLYSTVFILLGLLVLFDQKSLLKRYSGWALLIIGSACRHEGPIVLVIDGLFVALVYLIYEKGGKKSEYVKIFSKFIFAAILSFFLNFALVNLVDATPAPTWMKYTSFLADLGYLRSENPRVFSDVDMKLMEEISTEDSKEFAANCTSSGWMINSSGFNTEAASANQQKFLGVWIRSLKADPRTLLKGRFCRTQAFLPPILSSGPSYVYWNHLETSAPLVDGIFPSRDPNSRALVYSNSSSLRTLLSMWEIAWNYKWNLNIFQWPGLLGFLQLLFLILVFFMKRKPPRILIIFCIFSFARLLFLGLMAPGQDLRYALVTHLTFTITLVYLIQNLVNKFQGTRAID